MNVLLFGGREKSSHDYKAVCPVLMKYMTDAGCKVDYVVEDTEVFTRLRDSKYDGIAMYHTIGELTPEQSSGLLNWVASGKGFVGVHGTADSFRDCPEYFAMLGGRMKGHTFIREYIVSLVDNNVGMESKHDHPVLKDIDGYAARDWEKWPVFEYRVEDEQYLFDYDGRVNVLATALFKGNPLPVAWVKNWGEGKVFYLALGHNLQACQGDFFKKIFINGIKWACSG